MQAAPTAVKQKFSALCWGRPAFSSDHITREWKIPESPGKTVIKSAVNETQKSAGAAKLAAIGAVMEQWGGSN